METPELQVNSVTGAIGYEGSTLATGMRCPSPMKGTTGIAAATVSLMHFFVNCIYCHGIFVAIKFET